MTLPLFKTVGIAGIGLIGGSLARDIRSFALAERIIGWNRTPANAHRALELGLVDATVSTLEELVRTCDLTVLAMPVNILVDRLPDLLSLTGPGQILIDVGSTKCAITDAVTLHPNRSRFVACHPMAGTEKSGPDAAVDNLFKNRFTLLIDPEASDADALNRVRALWEAVGSRVDTLSAEAHDTTAALLSHMPHVLAYALQRTITDAERTKALNAQFAGGGLASMTRIAHSPIAMWQPIFHQNRDHLLQAIDDFTLQLQAFRSAIDEDNPDKLAKLML